MHLLITGTSEFDKSYEQWLTTMSSFFLHDGLLGKSRGPGPPITRKVGIPIAQKPSLASRHSPSQRLCVRKCMRPLGENGSQTSIPFTRAWGVSNTDEVIGNPIPTTVVFVLVNIFFQKRNMSILLRTCSAVPRRILHNFQTGSHRTVFQFFSACSTVLSVKGQIQTWACLKV